MSRSARPRRGRTGPRVRLRPRETDVSDVWSAGVQNLATCVNEALAALGMRPAYVFSAASPPGSPPGGVAMSVDVTPGMHRPMAGPRPRPRPGGASTTEPQGDARPPNDAEDRTGSSGTTGGSAGTDPDTGEHTEVWQLVERAQGGDGEAFGQLYDRYIDTVYRFIYYRVNDRALAEDFTSETFLRALRRIGTVNYQGRDIGAWFITIARNIVLDHVKSARNRFEVTTADTIESNDHAPSTEAAVMDTLTSERLMAAVNSLGDEQRECVMLRFIHGMSVSETAAIMGKNEGAIKALQHRAIRKLAELAGGELR